MTFDPSKDSPIKGCFPQSTRKTPEMSLGPSAHIPPFNLPDNPPVIFGGMPAAEPEVWVTVPMLLGHIAMWAVRQAQDCCPKQLEAVLPMYRNLLARSLRNTAEEEVGSEGVMMQCDRRRLHHFLLFTLPPLVRQYGWTDIDLDALIQNVCNSVFRLEDL